MAFEVLEGGGLENIPWPEMTEDQKRQYETVVWQDIEPGDGSDESIFKYFPFDSKALDITIKTLDALRTAFAENAAAHDIRDEWPYMNPEYVLRQLKMRARIESEDIRL